MDIDRTAPTALITGAARGIGAATAAALSQSGWNVALLDVADETALPNIDYTLASRDELHATAALLNEQSLNEHSLNKRCLVLEGDVRDQMTLSNAVSATVDRFGRLDAAVAAAGAITGGGPIWETSDLDWSTMIESNLSGAFHLARAAIPAMLEADPPRQGRFVAVASTAATVGLPDLGAYTVSKHGVLGLIRSLAADLGNSGITANAVSPGSTRTAMLDATAAVYELESAEAFAEHSRMERLLDPTEVASTIAWLCSAGASGITGANVAVDGGFTG